MRDGKALLSSHVREPGLETLREAVRGEWAQLRRALQDSAELQRRRQERLTANFWDRAVRLFEEHSAPNARLAEATASAGASKAGSCEEGLTTCEGAGSALGSEAASCTGDGVKECPESLSKQSTPPQSQGPGKSPPCSLASTSLDSSSSKSQDSGSSGHKSLLSEGGRWLPLTATSDLVDSTMLVKASPVLPSKAGACPGWQKLVLANPAHPQISLSIDDDDMPEPTPLPASYQARLETHQALEAETAGPKHATAAQTPVGGPVKCEEDAHHQASLRGSSSARPGRLFGAAARRLIGLMRSSSKGSMEAECKANVETNGTPPRDVDNCQAAASVTTNATYSGSAPGTNAGSGGLQQQL